MTAYERLWIFSDEFGSNSFERYFQKNANSEGYGYAKTHFDVSGYSHNSLSENTSVIGRLGNLMNNAIRASVINKTGKILPLPKLIVVVPDDDIIKCFKDYEDSGLSTSYSRLVNYIMTEHERGIASFKENLPAKARKEFYPHILWILAPDHNNFKNNQERFKFNKSVEDSCRFHCNINCLELKKVWNNRDDGLFSKEFQRFTADGYKKYWEAVDRTIRYCDSVVLKGKREKITKKPVEDRRNNAESCQNDRFRWMNPNIRSDVDKFRSYKKLPAPPSRRF